MPNLRIILENLVKNIQPGNLTDYRKEMINDAEREICGIIEKAVASVIREVTTPSEILGYKKGRIAEIKRNRRCNRRNNQ